MTKTIDEIIFISVSALYNYKMEISAGICESIYRNMTNVVNSQFKGRPINSRTAVVSPS